MGISPPRVLHSTTCRPSSPSALSPRLLQPPSTPPSLSATLTPTWPSPPPTHTSTQSLTTTPRLTSSSLSLTMVTVLCRDPTPSTYLTVGSRLSPTTLTTMTATLLRGPTLERPSTHLPLLVDTLLLLPFTLSTLSTLPWSTLPLFTLSTPLSMLSTLLPSMLSTLSPTP